MAVKIEAPKPTINGVKPEVAFRVYMLLNEDKRYFGSAGASLTHHVNDPDYKSSFNKKFMSAGLDGERGTSKIIRDWMGDKPNVVLLDSVHIKGMGKEFIDEETGIVEGGDTDHVLIIGNQVILIDTKRWKSKKRYSVSPQGKILRNEKYFSGGRVNTTKANYLWKKYLGNTINLKSIICINSPQIFVKMNDANWKKQPFRLVAINKLTESLDYIYKNIPVEDKNTINSSLIAQVLVCCVKPYDPYSKVFNNSIKNFK